jgi:glycosyltransferase involved in cell wall biosynthesis
VTTKHSSVNEGIVLKGRIRRFCYVSEVPVAHIGGRDFVSPYTMCVMRYPSVFFPEVILVVAPCAEQELDDRAERVDLAEFLHARVRFLPTARSRLWRWIVQLPTLWSNVGSADVVCVNLPSEASFLAALICRIRGKPLLAQVLGDWSEAVLLNGSPTVWRKIKSRLAEFMQHFPVRTAGLVFTQGRALLEKLSATNPGAVKSDFVHSTLTDEVFFRRPTPGFHVRPRILCVSRLYTGKGLEVLIRAIRILSQAGIKAECWFAGCGKLQPSLEALTASLGIQSSIRFLGYVPHGSQLFHLYREADIFVLPSYNEGVPNALLEAMAHSLPIVSTTVGSIPRTIRTGEEGILVGAGQPELLANAIAQLIEEPRKAWQMGQAAYQRAQDFRVGAVAPSHRRLIEECFGRIDSENSPNELAAVSSEVSGS